MTLLCKAIFYFPCIPNNSYENPCLLCSKTVCCFYFSDHMCIVLAEDWGFHVIILLSGNLILQSLLFHCCFQMFNEATRGHEILLVFISPSLYHFQSQNYWINGNIFTRSALHFLNRTPLGGIEKCGLHRQCRCKSPFFSHIACVEEHKKNTFTVNRPRLLFSQIFPIGKSVS